MKKLLVVTCCIHDNSDPVQYLAESCRRLKLDFAYYGIKARYTNFLDAKIIQLLEFLNTKVGEYEYCLFTDGFDSFMLQGELEIIHRFETFFPTAKVLIAGERSCYPDINLIPRFPDVGTSLRYPCAGQFMGKIEDVIAALNILLMYPPDPTDQLLWHHLYLAQRFPVAIDARAMIFLSAGGMTMADFFFNQNNMLYFNETKVLPCSIHFNGPKGDSENAKNMEYCWQRLYG